MKLQQFQHYAKMPVPWGPLGYITYKRTYARQINGRFEEWWETVYRVVNAIQEIGDFDNKYVTELYDDIFHLRCCPSGRALWQLGTPNNTRIGGDSLVNCWFVQMNDPLKPFDFLFQESMLGGGVGYSIKAEDVYSLPPVKFAPKVAPTSSKDCDFIVPDNREGWAELLQRVLRAHFFTGERLLYNTSNIRPKGAPILTFGGVASGPRDLELGVESICRLLARRVGKKLSPVDVLDIANILGDVVVSGNVRRTAQIAIGEYTDTEYLRAKTWEYVPPNWRSNANLSVYCENTEDLPQQFWHNYIDGRGECFGLVNLPLLRERGRTEDYANDDKIVGVNPCGEIGLENYECCNLFEIFLPNISTPKQWYEVAARGYHFCRAIAGMKYLYPETQEVVSRNKRIGIGVTGILSTRKSRNLFTHANTVYLKLAALNNKQDDPSIKFTTIKPSGTLSLLPGVTPGIHPNPAGSPYYFRTIRVASNNPITQRCREAGYRVEYQEGFDGRVNLDTSVVYFPVAAPDATQKVNAIEQLSLVKEAQANWSDNSVSVTVYYTPGELNAIKSWLAANYSENIKCVSFLLKEDHNFKQAPYQPITREQYLAAERVIQPLNLQDFSDLAQESDECSTGCPTK